MNADKNISSIKALSYPEKTGYPVIGGFAKALEGLRNLQSPLSQIHETVSQAARGDNSTPESELSVWVPEDEAVFDLVLSLLLVERNLLLDFVPQGSNRTSPNFRFMIFGTRKFSVVIDTAAPWFNRAEMAKVIARCTIHGHDLKNKLKALVQILGEEALPTAAMDYGIAATLLWYAGHAVEIPQGNLTLPYLTKAFIEEELTDVPVIRGITPSYETLAALQKKITQHYLLYRVLRKKLMGCAAILDLESRYLPVLVGMELAGIPINREYLEVIRDQYSQHLAELETDFKAAGFHVGNEVEVKRYFQSMNLDLTGFANVDFLQHKDSVAGEMVAKILEHRTLKSPTDFLASVLVAGGDRVHSHFKQIGMASGRMSAEKPNVQGIPRRFKDRFYLAPQGRAILRADIPGTDMRSAAAISDDPVLLDIFKKGLDPHRILASRLFGKPEADVTEDERDKAKPCNFGFIYGLGVDKFFTKAQKDGIALTKDEAKLFRNKFFETFPGLKAWQARVEEELKEFRKKPILLRQGRGGGIPFTTLYGRKVFATELGEALNYRVQGTSADVMKMAIVLFTTKARRQRLNAKIINSTHDDMVVETELDKVPETVEAMQEAFRDATRIGFLGIETEVDVKVISPKPNSAE